MASRPPSSRPWTRLASIRPVTAPPPAATPEPPPPPPPQLRPSLSLPTLRPTAQPQEPAPTGTTTSVLPPGAGVASLPGSPVTRPAVGVASVPTSPVIRPSVASVPTSPVTRPGVASVPTTPAPRPGVASVPTTPAPRPFFPSASLPPSPARVVSEPPVTKPSSEPISSKPASVPSSLPSVAAPGPVPSAVVSSSASPKPVAKTSSVPTSPARKAVITPATSAPTATTSPKIIKPAVQTPPQSPKPNPSAPPPSPLTLPPSRVKSDAEPEPKIPLVAEQKTVLVQKTIDKPKTERELAEDHSSSIAHLAKKESSFRAEEREKTHSKKTSSDSEDSGVRIITIAGDNKGAYMELIRSPSKHVPEGKSHFLHKNGNPKSDTGSSSDEGGRSKNKDENQRRKAMGSLPRSAFTNSNVQGVNNSIMFHSSCTHHDPGVHVALSRKPAGAGTPFTKDHRWYGHEN